VKYPLHDGYVRSCSQKEENFGFEEDLQVRRYIPNLRTRDWSQDPLQYTSGDLHGTTSREETRHYHQFDERSMSQLENGEANINDYFTATRGIETSSYEYPHLTGPYQTNLDEGTLNPYDQSALSGWCGEDSAGDRVSFLLFDMTDFNSAAVNKATLRMTQKKFPFNSKVQVRGACSINITNHDIRKHRSAYGPLGGISPYDNEKSLDDSKNVYGGDVAQDGSETWHEDSLNWYTAPFIYDDETDKVICEWSGSDEDIYHDQGPYECDITSLAKEYATSYLCLTLDMVHEENNSRDPTIFYSKEYQGKESPKYLNKKSFYHTNQNNIGGGGGDRNDNILSISRHEREQWYEGSDIWRSDSKSLVSDPLMGNARIMQGNARNQQSTLSSWYSDSTKNIPTIYSDINDINLPGLEYGTVRRYNGGASDGSASSYKFSGGPTGGVYGNTRPGGNMYNGGRLDRGGGGRGPYNHDLQDAAATRRPHLLIEGTECGHFPDHSSTTRCS
jgi:hypothetical protein